MIHMTHNRDHRSSGFFSNIGIFIHFKLDEIGSIFIFKAKIYFEFVADHFQRIAIQPLIHGNQLSHHKELCDDLTGRYVHNLGQLGYRSEFPDDNLAAGIFHHLRFTMIFLALGSFLHHLLDVSGDDRFVRFCGFQDLGFTLFTGDQGFFMFTLFSQFIVDGFGFAKFLLDLFFLRNHHGRGRRRRSSVCGACAAFAGFFCRLAFTFLSFGRRGSLFVGHTYIQRFTVLFGLFTGFLFLQFQIGWFAFFRFADGGGFFLKLRTFFGNCAVAMSYWLSFFGFGRFSGLFGLCYSGLCFFHNRFRLCGHFFCLFGGFCFGFLCLLAQFDQFFTVFFCSFFGINLFIVFGADLVRHFFVDKAHVAFCNHTQICKMLF